MLLPHFVIRLSFLLMSSGGADNFLPDFTSHNPTKTQAESFSDSNICTMRKVNYMFLVSLGICITCSASEDLSWEPLDRWFLHSEDVAPNSSMDRFLPLPRMQSAEPKIDTPVQPYLQHHEKQAAAFDTGKAIMSSIQHTGQHGASGVPTIPNNPRATESYPLHRELLSGLDWELPNFAAPELHCQPKHPHEDNPGFPLGPLSVDDYEIEDWPLAAQNGPRGDASGDPVVATGTEYSLCHQELLKSCDWALADILTHESHHHQKPPQHIVELSSSSGVTDHNIQAFLLPEEIEEMKNSPSWSEVPNLLPLHRETPETSIQRPLADFETLSKNLLKHPLEPFDETLLALGGHIPAQASKRRQTSLPSADPCVKSPSEKAITKFPSVTHKLKPGFPGNPELMIKNQLKRGRHKQLPRIQDLNEHQSKDGVPSSPRGIAGHGTIHLMNPDGAISLAQHRMMLVDRLKFDESVFIINQDSSPVDLEKITLILSFIQTHCGNVKRLEIPKMQPEYFHLVFDKLILSHQYSLKSMDLPSTTNKIKESPIKHKQRYISAFNDFYANSALWFRYWKDRTGIDLTRMHFHGHLQRSVSAKKAFTLVSFYLDMIGTILQNYHDAYSDGSTSDIGSIMIKKLGRFALSLLQINS
ncbi:hypothetical protein Pst134EA_019738 [Puccinia striiformis f. sp. tritici]|uniref:hypothetical protein n=1 Tax=Puccinia striiformis f. sp. tritici TaxID=168172 RepID=UPI002008DD27|nr:hypothetical protein Pst134EA_019738 [Puccinia striiformis f. sp. tritici]KAH9459597.1 hypothetical protein Pst134EA_019738 [Puccinia striiformis f. sp. tritici]